MLHTYEISHLLTPVILRAGGTAHSHALHFVDRSALFVLEKLGVSIKTQPDLSHAQNVLPRCAWIDKQLNNFFNTYPQGEGIEVDGGLSTRFHRLSEQLDWPRFSWCTINSHDVNDCLHFVFPVLDNYRSIGSNRPQRTWQKHLDWHTQTNKILIIGEQQPLNNWQEFTELYLNIQQALTPQTPSIDVLITHRISQLVQNCEQYALLTRVISSSNIGLDLRSTIRTWLGKLFGLKQPTENEYTHHLHIFTHSGEQ